jgi:hypothetical protein
MYACMYEYMYEYIYNHALCGTVHVVSPVVAGVLKDLEADVIGSYELVELER